jgi:hypothetical protein
MEAVDRRSNDINPVKTEKFQGLPPKCLAIIQEDHYEVLSSMKDIFLYQSMKR